MHTLLLLITGSTIYWHHCGTMVQSFLASFKCFSVWSSITWPSNQASLLIITDYAYYNNQQALTAHSTLSSFINFLFPILYNCWVFNTLFCCIQNGRSVQYDDFIDMRFWCWVDIVATISNSYVKYGKTKLCACINQFSFQGQIIQDESWIKYLVICYEKYSCNVNLHEILMTTF